MQHPDGRSSRPSFYHFPPLAECRRQFDVLSGYAVAWKHATEDWSPGTTGVVVAQLAAQRRLVA